VYPSSSLPLSTIASLTHPAARSLCDSWATCFHVQCNPSIFSEVSSSSAVNLWLLFREVGRRRAAKMVVRMARKQCALLLVLAITTPCHVSVASPVSAASSSTPQTTNVDLLMPNTQPQVVRPQFHRMWNILIQFELQWSQCLQTDVVEMLNGWNCVWNAFENRLTAGLV